ncbi:MAG: CvpA family protein [Patescibacteria group bacterium]
MTIFDTILLVILAGFVFYGLFYGLIRTLGSLVGVIAGAYLASRWYLIIFDYAQDLFFGYNNLGKVLTFIILFTIINRLIGWLFSILDKTFNILSIIPFLKTINRLAGAVFGFIEGALVLGLVLYVASRYAILGTFFGKWLVNSEIAPFLLRFVEVLKPLLPEVLKKLQGLI